jgi:sugar phosphate isomerase/epimerase
VSCVACLPLGAADPIKTAKPRELFAFCMDTHDSKKRSLQEQAELLKELGYAGAGHLWLDGLAERIRTLDASGLKLFQVYFRVDISTGAKEPYDPKLKEALPLLKGRGTQIAALVGGGKPSDASLDPRAVEILREIADLARPYGVGIALYPHAGDWLERVEDGVRLTKKVDRPDVGVMFNLCHWLKVAEEKDLKPLLTLAGPHLAAVSINGADRAVDVRSGKGSMILPLGQGAFDMLAFLDALEDAGYKGPVGLQCYGLPGDAKEHLARSMEAWRKLLEKCGGNETPGASPR